eukprot:CAMPEP_0113966380 /NCGR_PEP_ID=MMETSP0011_2-20120614/8298_1 /TAXON_ID=101924 /ORGANISM="Rhodosorus marinus" /LENGTH=67 /DNA_ID=CAMNT_0000979057 /DNA_START=185 /DNA_END=388 /DNA_ORIENTATION=- /assembly_acc=CAM_ASM_000156
MYRPEQIDADGKALGTHSDPEGDEKECEYYSIVPDDSKPRFADPPAMIARGPLRIKGETERKEESKG